MFVNPSNGLYVTVLNNGGKLVYHCDTKSIAKIKKEFNGKFADTYATLHIVKVENGIETILYAKQFDALRKTNWLNIERKTEAGYNDLVSYEPAKEEVESQPAEEVESQPAEKEIESQPAEKEIESQPAEEVESQPAGFKRYLCIVFEIKMQDGEYHRKYKRFDVSRETNIDNIQRFADSYTRGISGKAYIIDKVGRFYFIIKQKQYKPNADTKWSREEKNSTCKAFVDLFIQKGVH